MTTEPADIARRIEAILLVVDEPQSLVALAAAVGSPVPAVRQAVDALVADYDGEAGGPRRGFELRVVGGGLRPYMFVMPVIKTEQDRLALREAATSGDACFFLGTDSAPHPVSRKLAQVGIPGIFAAPVAIESYVKIFEEEGKLDKLEAFASLNGPKHYGLHPNADTITLEKKPWVAPVAMKVEGPEEIALCHKGGETIEWQVVDC